MPLKTNKSTARIQRQIDKLAKNHTKSARLSDGIEIKDKYIRSVLKPPLAKTPRSNSPENYKNYFFSWCDTHSDTDGNWSWFEPRQWSKEEYSEIIKQHMDSHNNDSWYDVEAKTYNGKNKERKSLNKYQPVDSICDEALDRWLNLESLSQFEELFRLRAGSNRRIWGVRIFNHFYMVWYERNHKICPIDN